MRTAIVLLLLAAPASAGEFHPGSAPQYGFGRYRVTVVVAETDRSIRLADIHVKERRKNVQR